MTERLPDSGEANWADILGARDGVGGFLRVAHEDDGTLKYETAHTETAFGDVTAISPAGNVILPVGTPFIIEDGGAIIEASDPEKPTVLSAGIYAVTVEIFCAAGPAVGPVHHNLQLDYANNDWISSQTILAEWGSFWTSMSMTAYIPAGGIIQVNTVNSADDSVDCNLGYSEIQRIT